MRAGDLAKILEHVDPDTEVHVIAGGGCQHVTKVNYKRRRLNRYGGTDGRYAAGDTLPRSLVIEGGGGYPTIWFHEPPDFRLDGSWPRSTELLTKLDPDTPIGEETPDV